MRLMVSAVVSLLVAGLGVGVAGEIDEAKLKTHALVTWYDAGAPLGRFVLIRKDTHVCAVRFTEYRRGNDAKPSTMFNSGEESFNAKYECASQVEWGRGFGNVTTAEVSKGASWGVGRLAFQSGEMNVKCGPYKLPWMYPTRVSFHIFGTRLGDHGIELAPTRWSDIKEVDVSSTRLRWFRYDEGRKDTYIPIEKL
jgi:hypothetical protein